MNPATPPLLTPETKATIEKCLWEGQTVDFDENGKGFSVISSEVTVHADQFISLITERKVSYEINVVSFPMHKPGFVQVHFALYIP